MNPLVSGVSEDKRVRCFVTAVTVDKPDFNRLVSTVHYEADHSYRSGIKGSISTPDGSKYRIGDVVWVTVEFE